MRALRRLLVLLPVLFLLVGCAAQGSGAESRAESQSEQTALATEAESTQRESSESGTAKSKKKQKKSKKSKKSKQSDKRQSDKAATSASETLIEAETSEALTSTAAEETRTAAKRTAATRASERDTETGDEVALYLHTYGKLPKNFISKKEAEEQGFRFGEGDFGEAFPGMSVGGSRFGNYEGQLPEKSGRHYYECDIDYQGGRRNAKRLVYSNDGLIFYTDDHYKSFTQLY